MSNKILISDITGQPTSIDPSQFHGNMTRRATLFGKQTYLYSIGCLAQILRKQADTIRKWEKKGVVPKPILREATGHRWYLKEEVIIYFNATQRHVKNGGVDPLPFSQEVHSEVLKLRKIIIRIQEQYHVAQKEKQEKNFG